MTCMFLSLKLTVRAGEIPLIRDCNFFHSVTHQCDSDSMYAYSLYGALMQAIVLAIEKVKEQEWFKQCQVWLYRGAWQEFQPHETEMAVPLSPADLKHKIDAIFRHQSQKDRAMFPGADPREFWQRARDRNKVRLNQHRYLRGILLHIESHIWCHPCSPNGNLSWQCCYHHKFMFTKFSWLL